MSITPSPAKEDADMKSLLKLSFLFPKHLAESELDDNLSASDIPGARLNMSASPHATHKLFINHKLIKVRRTTREHSSDAKLYACMHVL